MITVPTSNDIHKLNDAWELLGAEYDKFWSTLSKTGASAINKSLADWQDFYYGNWDAWPDFAPWRSVLQKSIDLLNAEIKKGATASAPIVSTPTTPVTINEPTYVFGKVEPKPPVIYDPDAYALTYTTSEYSPYSYKEKPINWGWVAGGIGALGLIYSLTRK